MASSVFYSPAHQSCDLPRTTETGRSLLSGRQGLEEFSEINGRRGWGVSHRMELCPVYNRKVALGQRDRLSPAFEVEPAGALSDDVKYGPISFEADAPWRAELGSVSDATLWPDPSKHLLKQWPAPRLECGAARRQRDSAQASKRFNVLCPWRGRSRAWETSRVLRS